MTRTVMVLLSSATLLAGASSALALPQAPASPAARTAPGTNPDAALLVDFRTRIDQYTALRNQLKKDAPPLKTTKDPAQIKASQDVLAAKIRDARKSAKEGDIFTPEIRQLFRRLMYPEVKGPQGAETKAAITEEAHEVKQVPLKVNAAYPDGAPLMTVPPNILAALPKLPDDLEYRFVNRTMILLDTHANLIVDFVPGAIQ